MKFILVPPHLVAPMRKILETQPSAELPDIAGMPVLVSRHCPPDTGYVLTAEAIPEIKPPFGADFWKDLDPAPRATYLAHLDATWSMDYISVPRGRFDGIKLRKMPLPPRKWYETGGILDRVATWFYLWQLRFRWWSYPARQWVRELWWEMKWESRSPFRDSDESDRF